jgi:hypothetical protein
VSRLRIALAAVGLAAAVVAALLASDLRSWQDGIQNGDAQYFQRPASATWSTPTLLPFQLARGILGISDQIAFRHAARAFVTVHTLGNGFDNGYTELRARANLEIVLTALARGPDRSRDSAADNLLGILAYSDSQTTGTAQPAPVDRAVADFQSSVQLDPANTDAKFNLEWVQRQLVAHGSRAGSTTSSVGANRGHHGAGGGSPGKGY